MDGSGTIDPAALNTPAVPAALPSLAPQSHVRGIKRIRSTEGHGNIPSEDVEGDDTRPPKRGKSQGSKVSQSPSSSHIPLGPPPPVQTPQMRKQSIPQTSPTQASPSQTTPGSGGKPAVLKALPTVRDHTTDQLNPEGDEYIPREYDEAGEQKVSANGYLMDGREYRCRTFVVPHRGEKLFMLATECARVLGYRDSYLLFNKNRSLYKIIANQAEKDNLIHQDILLHSYRSRQIAIVTARSMYRQFGSRVIVNGRRVRDDYWETKARKQGFTEEDAAGEKRPGAAKQREVAAAEVSGASTLTALPQGEIIYSNTPNFDGRPQLPPGIHPVTLAPLPMIHLPTDDVRPRDFGNVLRPRQEITGAPYVDRTQPSSDQELLNQASQAAAYNKDLTQQRISRGQYLGDYWKRPHEVPQAPAQQPPVQDVDTASGAPQSLHSPPVSANAASMSMNPQAMLSHQPASSAQMMGSQSYPQQQQHQQQQQQQQQSHVQNAMAQSPVRAMHPTMSTQQMLRGSPAMGAGPALSHRQTPSYAFPQNQMWPPPQLQPSPLSQSHHHLPQYAQHHQSHTPQPQQSPMHPPAPQLTAQPSAAGSMHPAHMGYPSMPQMGNSAYPSVGRNMYPQVGTPQHYGMGNQGASNQQAGVPGWPPVSNAGQFQQQQQQDWQRFQQQ
ncbi:hypothetical protein LTR50_003573 [Elasticomyces elasticus]|nr:hypothetical protein LTR50_003573 [Elasticomyces elasticus]